MAHHNCPYDLNHKPIHRMDGTQGKAWLMGGELRRVLGSWLLTQYPQGCGITEDTYHLVGWCDDRGQVFDLMPPYRTIHYSRIANKPAVQACPCAEFYDPESNGPWRNRGDAKARDHHPLCQYDQHSTQIWGELQRRGFLPPDGVIATHAERKVARPDEWNNIREEIRKS